MSETISRVGSNNSLPMQSHPIQSKPVSDGRIEAKIQSLQELWSHYEENRSSIIYGDILSGVKELDSLLVHVPHAHSEAHDFAFACRLSLQENPLPSLPTSHRDQVLQLLQEQEGLALHKVNGDGNCGIHAVLTAIHPDYDTTEMVHITRGDMVAELKKACYEEIDNQWEAVLKNQTAIVPTLGEHHGDRNIARSNIDKYCARMAKNGAWIGERELSFLAKVLGITINVYDPYKTEVDRANRKLTFNDSMMAYGNSDNRISIFHDSNHYDALRPTS